VDASPAIQRGQVRQAVAFGFFGFFGALFGALLVAALIGLVTFALNGDPFDFSGEPPPPSVKRIGQAQKVGSVQLTVHAVRDSQGENLLQRPSAGQKWVIVEVSARNTSSDTYFLTAYYQTHLRDREGRNYNMVVVLGPQLRGNFDGTIPGRGTLRGEVAFEVPQNATGLVFLFQELRGSGQALWALQ
jgi:hypothetical protein